MPKEMMMIKCAEVPCIDIFTAPKDPNLRVKAMRSKGWEPFMGRWWCRRHAPDSDYWNDWMDEQ